MKKMPASDASFFMLKSMARPRPAAPGPSAAWQTPPAAAAGPYPAHLLPGRPPAAATAAAETAERAGRGLRRGRGLWRGGASGRPGSLLPPASAARPASSVPHAVAPCSCVSLRP